MSCPESIFPEEMKRFRSEPAVPMRPLPPLQRNFYDRDPRRVSRDLLGKLLVRRDERKLRIARIVEVEAYLGQNDPAAHSFAGRTLRNAVLWGPPGFAYVYFIYGNHYCFNASCLRDGEAGGVLFRALEPLAGLEAMARGRDLSLEEAKDLRKLTSGPGRLAEAPDVIAIGCVDRRRWRAPPAGENHTSDRDHQGGGTAPALRRCGEPVRVG
jgi:DNA-3-methyladenine glycosylase